MKIIGLTGSIGMGKSTTANFFRAAGVPVHDADQAVHDLYRGAAAPLVEEEFPGVVRDGVVDRDALFLQVSNNAAALKRLEAIIHPLVHDHRQAAVVQAQQKGFRTMVLDIPLLFETGSEHECDVVIVVSAPFHVQKQRVLARKSMTEARFEAILTKQMPDTEKRRRAHFIIDTGLGLLSAERQVKSILCCLQSVPGGNKSRVA